MLFPQTIPCRYAGLVSATSMSVPIGKAYMVNRSAVGCSQESVPPDSVMLVGASSVVFTFQSIAGGKAGDWKWDCANWSYILQ